MDNMQPSELKELHYLITSNPSLYTAHLNMIDQNNSPTIQLKRFSDSLYNYPSSPQEFNPNSSCISSNSTSDEADEQQLKIIQERKQRRMISNRESARRSRMRKQRHLDELWSQVVWLRDENHQLLHKLNRVSENHDKVVQENVQLKEETSELRRMVSEMQLNSHYSTLKDLEHVPDVSCSSLS